MAKALTGGLEMVMIATPSYPTSRVTLTSAIASRNHRPRIVVFYRSIKKVKKLPLRGLLMMVTKKAFSWQRFISAPRAVCKLYK